jgi:hypothetical protein
MELDMEREQRVRSTMVIRRSIWLGLRKLAERDDLVHGGRPSMSRTIEVLVEREIERSGASGFLRPAKGDLVR